MTDAELDELAPAVVADLGIDEDGHSRVVGRNGTVGLRAISLESPENSFYQHLVDQYRDQPTAGPPDAVGPAARIGTTDAVEASAGPAPRPHQVEESQQGQPRPKTRSAP
ncbi:hypothetical protein [Nocardia beijingensis]|uniref:hypothetical protein n=1 Tax=Nocardia beijingensis TaxID=95162 RepID=UPI001895E061|nr:hypothetical protein [Nocardia beijingensis]